MFVSLVYGKYNSDGKILKEFVVRVNSSVHINFAQMENIFQKLGTLFIVDLDYSTENISISFRLFLVI